MNKFKSFIIIVIILCCSRLFAGSGQSFIDTGTSTATPDRVVKFDSTGKIASAGIPSGVVIEKIVLTGTSTDQQDATNGVIWNDISQTGTTSSDYNNNAFVLLHMNTGSNTTTFVNSGNGNTATTSGDAKMSNVNISFNGNSGYFPGAEVDHIEFIDSDNWPKGTQSFSMQVRYRPNSTANNATFWSQGRTDFKFNSVTNSLEFYYSPGTTTVIAGSWTVSVGNTYVFECTRSGDNWYLFAGTQTAGTVSLIATAMNTVSFIDGTQTVYIGSEIEGAATYACNGWLDEFYYGTMTLHTGTYTVDTNEFGSEVYQKKILTIEDMHGTKTLKISTGSGSGHINHASILTPRFTIGTETWYGGTVTSYSMQTGQGLGGILTDNLGLYCFESIKGNFESGTSVQTQVYDDIMGLNLFGYNPRVRYVSSEDIENMAKFEYVNSGNYEEWKGLNRDKYLVEQRGTETIYNENLMLNDYSIERQIEWMSSLEQDSLLLKAKDDMELDKTVKRYSLITTDPTTPSYMKDKTGTIREIGSELGAFELAFQHLAKMVEAQQTEIEYLKTLLPYQRK